MKVIASIAMFLYHSQTMKQELWTTLVMYMAYFIDKQRQEGHMRCKMNKFTVLESPTSLLQQEYRLFEMLGLNENMNLRHYCVSRQL